ncbi:DUF3226 domain-containing protein [Oxynema aestuarii]|uniref:DUF4435 domain-containing protein n=1 Tax=Oxynema aestuarii AP17 TaxID=2064643 RepID=A0A6H1TXE9_9CYAN|nr:DUF3226 domain-containing protein [Oxynema aestuarii]QIZ70886.1 hypothetical protein HCG48_10050 [Oxynema aestuarii AP17]
MPKKSYPKQLLVEGNNDRHVIWALCQKYELPKTFSVEMPTEGEGIDAVFKTLPVKLRESKLETLGIVVDADESKLKPLGIVVDADKNLEGRWQGIRDRLIAEGYDRRHIPKVVPTGGWIYDPSDRFLKKLGVWLMPDNQTSGMLEDFVAYLIPKGDLLEPEAKNILKDLENRQLNHYALVHRPKAFIHTWLAWQKTPGMPMGQAMTARVLDSDREIARLFIGWLRNLFDL